MEDNETPVVTVEELAGVEEGTILSTPDGEPDEKVVADLDEDGNVIGWHKEVV